MRTKEIGTDNTSFFVDKLGEECTPTQQLREFVQNSCEAIQRVQTADPTYAGRIVLDFEPYWSERCGVAKLSIVDNGDGMSADDLQRYMNNLSASGSQQGIDKNFGVGAKISSLAQNPHGVVFESWRDGAGHMIHMWRDPTTGRYGLKPLSDEAGNEAFVLPLVDDARPEAVTRSGTRVVLLGRAEESNTCIAPDDVDAKSEWLIKTLNRRYFRFPKQIAIVARTNPALARADNACPTRNVYGQGAVLDNCAVHKGAVSLRGATARWWLLPDTEAGWREARGPVGHNSKAGWGRSYEVTGHVAVLVRDELYLHRLGSSRHGSRARAVLQEFGVTAGTSHVVIYVEPSDVSINLSRTAPIFEDHDPPWAEWGAEFREKMPPELAAYVESIHNKADSSVAEEIRKRLAPMMELFSPPRFRRSAAGPKNMDADSLTEGGSGDLFVPPPEDSERKPRPKNPSGRSHGGGRGASLADRVKPLGPEATQIAPLTVPKVEWTSDSDIGDRAAEYVRVNNTIMVNRGFRVFQQIAEKLEAEFAGRPGASTVIWHQIESWFGQQLVEAVLGVQALVTTRGGVWDQKTVDEMTTPEALTVAVCVRYLALNQIRSIASKTLGRPVEAEVN